MAAIMFALGAVLLLALLPSLGWLCCQRRRSDLVARQLLAEQRIDRQTQRTLAAMRQAVRQSLRERL